MTASQITDIIGHSPLRKKPLCAQAVTPGTFRRSNALAFPDR